MFIAPSRPSKTPLIQPGQGLFADQLIEIFYYDWLPARLFPINLANVGTNTSGFRILTYFENKTYLRTELNR
jgi:hypothetical protein